MSDYILHVEDRTVLCHHGVKGQKWGIRRYQNEDGTLTKDGQKRYVKAYKSKRFSFGTESPARYKERKQLEKEADDYFKSTKEYKDLVEYAKRDPYAVMRRKANQIAGERKGNEYRKAAKKVAEEYKEVDPSFKGKSYEEILNKTHDIDLVNPDRIAENIFESLYNKSGRSKLDKKYNGSETYDRLTKSVSEMLSKNLNTTEIDKNRASRLVSSILGETYDDASRYKNW